MPGEIGEIPGTGGGGLGPGTPEESSAPVYEQVSFRFRNDDGGLVAPP